MNVNGRIAVALALLLGACGGGGGGSHPPPAEPFGLTQRTPVQGLTFPLDAAVGDVVLEVAFPSLAAFDHPLAIVTAPDDPARLYVVEQGGKVWTFENRADVTARTLFLDLSDRTKRDSEQGLLGLVFDPGYASNGYVYADYSANAALPAGTPGASVVARYAANTATHTADRTTELKLLQIPDQYINHNGGGLAFGPDKKLYISTGDGGSQGDPDNNAQNLGSVLGKILRLNPDGTIPADNPFAVGVPENRGEIWAYGLRNPWRFSFDRATGELWAADVGQNKWEEIDIIVKGGNYGWRKYEGNDVYKPNDPTPANAIAPVYAYDHGSGCSITGGYVYRGGAIPKLSGWYVYSDYCSGHLWALARDGASVTNVELTDVPVPGNPTSFGEDAAGELYIASFNGKIYKLKPANSGGGTFPKKLSETGLFSDVASLTPQAGLIEYDINAPFWSDGAHKRRWLALPGAEHIGFDAQQPWGWPRGTVVTKHFEIPLQDGSTRRLETRVLVHRASGWQGYTYRWDSAGGDADLVEQSATETLQTRDAGGNPQTQDYEFPGSDKCLRCHTAAAGYVLGLHTTQINRERLYPNGVTDNQLRAFNHIGLFDRDIGDDTQYTALATPDDPAAPLPARARAYLDSNCSQCHRPDGPTPLNMDLRAQVAVAEMNTHDVPPSDGDLGLADARRIAPTHKESSVLWERMRRRDAVGMPPLTSHLADAAGVALIGQWIDAGAL